MATPQHAKQDVDPAVDDVPPMPLRNGEPLSDPYAVANGKTGRPPKYVLTDEIRAALEADFDGRRATNDEIGQRFDVPSWKIGEWARELKLPNKIQPRYTTGKEKGASRPAESQSRPPSAAPPLVRTPLPVIMDDEPSDAPDYRILHDLLDLLPADGVWASMDRREHWLSAFRALVWILTELPERSTKDGGDRR